MIFSIVKMGRDEINTEQVAVFACALFAVIVAMFSIMTPSSI